MTKIPFRQGNGFTRCYKLINLKILKIILKIEPALQIKKRYQNWKQALHATSTRPVNARLGIFYGRIEIDNKEQLDLSLNVLALKHLNLPIKAQKIKGKVLDVVHKPENLMIFPGPISLSYFFELMNTGSR